MDSRESNKLVEDPTIINQDQISFSNFYRYAVDRASKRDYETARRSLVCAISLLLKLSSESTDESVKDSFKRKAMNLFDSAVRCGDTPLEDLLVDLSKEYLGCQVNLEENETIVKSVVKKTTFSDVAGLEDVKESVKQCIVNPVKYPKIYKRYNKKIGGGILLYGMPGTGKTLIAKAIANEVDAAFYPIKCSDIVSKWFGESEQNVRDVFEEAKKQPLSIIFFDEFEALGAKRDTFDPTMKRIVPELLAQIQGFDACPNVIIIGATNRPWDIDSAFLRPGRFSRKIYVPLPDSDARRIIIENSFYKVPLDGVDIEEIVKATERFSGADVEELCDFAKNYAIDREILTKKNSAVTRDDILQALGFVRSSIDLNDERQMKEYMQNNKSRIA